MAFYPELQGLPLEARNLAVKEMLNRATRELNLSRDQLVVSPLRPTDLGNGGGTWETISVATTMSELHNVTVADNTWLSVYGLFYGGNKANEASTAAGQDSTWRVFTEGGREDIQRLRITRMGSVSRDWTINMIPFLKNKTGYADDPIIVDQNTNITTELAAITASTLNGRSYAFLGDVVEKKGLVINP